jgi:hypothetical protein
MSDTLGLPPSDGTTVEGKEPQPLPPFRGNSSEAPMIIHPGAIIWIARGSLLCVALGYLSLLFKVVCKPEANTSIILVFSLHSVCMFGLLLKYFGGTLKVTNKSAETG